MPAPKNQNGPQAGSPPRGLFLDHTYTNDYFTLSFRLPPEWVLETSLIRTRREAEKQSDEGTVLLAAVHIPQDVTELRADSSFVLLAVKRSAGTNTESCFSYVDALIHSREKSKDVTQKNEVRDYTVGAREFWRVDFAYGAVPNDRTTLCSPAKEYLLLWNFEGAYWDDVNDAISTTYTIVPWPPAKTEAVQRESPKIAAAISITPNAANDLLLRKVQPVYPPEARQNRIRGTVRLQAVISKEGDIVNLELLDGPIELAVSAVNAVRQWKYKPYLVDGQPTEVHTEIIANYFARPM